MSLLVSNIITDRVRILLRDIDTGGVQWKDAELIGWLNEACGEIARVRPEASSVTIELSGSASPVAGVNLVPGAKQTIPNGGSRLLEVVCNSVGGAEGRAIRRIERSTLDNEDPDWMSSARTTNVFRYAASLTDPRSFYVYPPTLATAASGISIVFSSPPASAAGLGDSLPLPDMYAAPVANYILFRAFSKLTESADSQQRAGGYLQLFNSQVSDTHSSMEQDNAVVRDPINGENR